MAIKIQTNVPISKSTHLIIIAKRTPAAIRGVEQFVRGLEASKMRIPKIKV